MLLACEAPLDGLDAGTQNAGLALDRLETTVAFVDLLLQLGLVTGGFSSHGVEVAFKTRHGLIKCCHVPRLRSAL